MSDDFRIFSGAAHPSLASAVAAELGVEPGACSIDRFPDGEVAIRLLESVRRKEVYVVQPTSPPVNDHLVELFAFADACRRAAVNRIIAVVPYFGYARSDKRSGRREPITASMVARLLEAAGVDHVLTVDLHTIQIEGFFHIPVDTLTAVPPLCEELRGELPPDTVVVAPDAGRVTLATEYAERLGMPLAVLHKRRSSGRETRVTHLVGEVRGRPCLLIDDMISTGGTIVESTHALLDAGAAAVRVAATHGLLLSGAVRRLRDAGVEAIRVTDTVPVAAAPGVEVTSLAPLLGRAIRKLYEHGSLQELF